MNEIDFIELTIRYLDGAAGQTEIDLLGAAMQGNSQRRELYRELVQQSQLAHEWHLSWHAEPETQRFPLRRIAALTAAAAALVIASILLFWQPQENPQEATRAPSTKPQLPDYFQGDPSWSDIYRSPFDYPDFVWRAEIPASSLAGEIIDEFSMGEMPALAAATPPAAFSRLLAPIVLLPTDENFGSYLY